MSDPEWLRLAKVLRTEGTQYLQALGWGDFDIDFLAAGSKLPGPKTHNAILKSKSVNGRPPAEIVSAARMIQTADALINSWSTISIDELQLGIFTLGEDQALARVFRKDTGHPAQAVDIGRAYEEIAYRQRRLRTVAAHKSFNLQKNRAKKLGSTSEKIAERDKVIRLFEKCVRLMPGHPSRIAGKVTNVYNKAAYKTYPPFHRLTSKTIRKILRGD